MLKSYNMINITVVYLKGDLMKVKNVERLGFGFMRLPTANNEIDFEQLIPMVDYFIEHGGKYFDTGYQYHNGKSEEEKKKAVIERYPREKVKIADKMPIYIMTNDDNPKEIFNTQLERCGVEYFDYYLVHNTSETFYEGVCKELKVFEILKELKEERKIRKIGISHHDTPEILEKVLNENPEIEFVQIQLNYLDWENPAIQSKKCYEITKKHGLSVNIMEPVKGGNLVNLPFDAEKIFKDYSKDTNAAWAIKYALNLERAELILSGMSNMEQVKDNIKTVENFKKLTKEEENRIKQVTEILLNTIEIPCTYCDYCADQCPKNIPISKYFSLYNNKKQTIGNPMLHPIYYNNYAQKYEKASSCIECHECEKVCPQKIEIADNLKKVVELLENKI